MEPPSSVQCPSFGLLRIIKLGKEQTLFPLTTRTAALPEMGKNFWAVGDNGAPAAIPQTYLFLEKAVWQKDDYI